MAPSNPVRLATLPLYGILATERSSLLGQRRLAKAHYAHSLVRLVLGRRLPGELVNQIAEDLTSLEYADMLKLWRTLAGEERHRETHFRLPAMGGTEAERSAAEELRTMSHGVLCCKVVVGGADGVDARYVHISASEKRPDLAQIVPGAASNSGPKMQYAGGHMVVQCSPGSASESSRERVQIWPNSAGHQVGRLVQIDSVEDAIKQWDQEAAERYVKFLGLKVISMTGEDGEDLVPRLRLLQTVEWM